MRLVTGFGNPVLRAEIEHLALQEKYGILSCRNRMG
jgi:hypothetical protein